MSGNEEKIKEIKNNLSKEEVRFHKQHSDKLIQNENIL